MPERADIQSSTLNKNVTQSQRKLHLFKEECTTRAWQPMFARRLSRDRNLERRTTRLVAKSEVLASVYPIEFCGMRVAETHTVNRALRKA
jgi:hypothetical protein